MTHLQISRYIQSNYLTKLQDYEINSLDDLNDLHQELIKIRVDLTMKGYPVQPVYRGEKLYGRDIVPGLVRDVKLSNVNPQYIRYIEERGIRLFQKQVEKKYGKKFLWIFKTKTSFGPNWDILFQAQHAGIKTNLIDVSPSISHAAYFTCSTPDRYKSNDGQLWCILVPDEFHYIESTEYNKNCYPNYNAFNLETSFLCNPPIFLDEIEERTYQFRLYRQRGKLFTSSDETLNIPLNKKIFWENMIIRIRISPEAKVTIARDLDKININMGSMILDPAETHDRLIRNINKKLKITKYGYNQWRVKKVLLKIINYLKVKISYGEIKQIF